MNYVGEDIAGNHLVQILPMEMANLTMDGYPFHPNAFFIAHDVYGSLLPEIKEWFDTYCRDDIGVPLFAFRFSEDMRREYSQMASCAFIIVFYRKHLAMQFKLTWCE